MSQYQTIKRNAVLFPESEGDFEKAVFALREELHELLMDSPDKKAEILQVALDTAVDLESYLAEWKLKKVVAQEKIDLASGELIVFAKNFGAPAEAVEAAKAEIASIAASSCRRFSEMYDEGAMSTVWGHDYASGLEFSLRRGARWVTSNPCKIQLYKRDFPEKYQAFVEEIKREVPEADASVKAAKMFTKVCAVSARALRPIYDATGGEFGFVCMQVDPREIRNAKAMIDQVHFWYRDMAEELGVEIPNVVFKLPAVKEAFPVVEELLREKKFRLCMTLNFTVTQHAAFAKLLEKSDKRHFLVMMAGQFDDKVANELAEMGYEDAKVIARYGSEAVMRKSYKMLEDAGYKNLSIMSAAVRGPWHIKNSFAPAGKAPFYITTVVPKIQEFDANPSELSSVIYEPTDAKMMEILDKSKLFHQAYDDEGIGWEELYSFPPFVGFFDQFSAAYQEIEDDFR